uniref:Phosducin domain-containing protein n=1 Tax=Panagrellus redivivus TaxID=6233 RepID=A0A7E4UPZ9_PANRE
MSTLDEKFLDGPTVGYCSDSDEEAPSASVPAENEYPGSRPQSAQTGPKGVLNDYKRHGEELRQKKLERDAWLRKEAQRMTVKPNRNTDNKANDDDDSDDESALEKIRRQRMNMMRDMRRGRIMEVPDKHDFVRIVDSSVPDEVVFMHIYRDGLEGCQFLNDALLVLAGRIEKAKFYKVKATLLETSKSFEENALPTLQVYVNGDLTGNFVRITDDLSEDFGCDDLIQFLGRHEIALSFANTDNRLD